MITGLTEEQFRHLPTVSLHYPCDKCGKQREYGYLKRSLDDYSVVDGKLVEKDTSTAVYLCNGCNWEVQCAYMRLPERDEE